MQTVTGPAEHLADALAHNPDNPHEPITCDVCQAVPVTTAYRIITPTAPGLALRHCNAAPCSIAAHIIIREHTHPDHVQRIHVTY